MLQKRMFYCTAKEQSELLCFAQHPELLILKNIDVTWKHNQYETVQRETSIREQFVTSFYVIFLLKKKKKRTNIALSTRSANLMKEQF